ncbi:MFS transporter [Parapedomonas caeni]
MGRDLFEHMLAGARSDLGRALVLTILVQLVATSVALALPPIAPRVAADFGVGAHAVGYQISLLFCAGAVGSGLAGTFIRRHGAIRLEQAGLLMFALGLLGLATANLVVGVLATLMIGLAYGFQNPASSQILGAVTPAVRRNVVFSVKQAAVPLGAVLVSLGLPLLDAVVGWRLGFLLLAGLPLVLLVVLSGHPMPGEERRRDAPFLAGLVREQRLVWRRRELRVLALIGLLFSSVQLSLSAFTVLMLVADAGWSLLSAASVAAAVQMSGMVGRIFWGVVADRWRSGLKVLTVIGIGCGAAVLSLPWLAQMPPLVQVALLCALGLCLNGWNGVAMAEVLRQSPPAEAGSVLGGTLVYVFVGVMVGPSSFALLFGLTGGYGRTFALTSLLLLAGGIAALIAQWRAGRRTGGASAND